MLTRPANGLLVRGAPCSSLTAGSGGRPNLALVTGEGGHIWGADTYRWVSVGAEVFIKGLRGVLTGGWGVWGLGEGGDFGTRRPDVALYSMHLNVTYIFSIPIGSVQGTINYNNTKT